MKQSALESPLYRAILRYDTGPGGRQREITADLRQCVAECGWEDGAIGLRVLRPDHALVVDEERLPAYRLLPTRRTSLVVSGSRTMPVPAYREAGPAPLTAVRRPDRDEATLSSWLVLEFRGGRLKLPPHQSVALACMGPGCSGCQVMVKAWPAHALPASLGMASWERVFTRVLPAW